ncbi:response regulator transcription factor [Halomonas campisalis]|nr:response regulator transcription factor [Halomonas campisalis]MDR5861351.1 response regulator transcription factor [Halomonas campisalis]
MAVYFISQGRDEIPRWREAFRDAAWIGPQDAHLRVGAGDLVWVVSNLPGWPAVVASLSGVGAHLAVLSYRPQAAEAFQALEVGARGYTHALSPPELLRQVQVVISHQGIWVPAELMSRVVGGAFRALGGSEQVQIDELQGLTERERAVALAVLEGQTNKEVARSLGITERTVKAHLGAVFNKLGVRNRMQLVLRLSQQHAAVTDPGH